MFTQCSNCHTVFQLSADVLRAAGGQVRCGRCGEIFSALARLAEDAGSFDTGESAYELEERADSILESVVAEHVAQAMPDAEDEDEEDFGGAEIAQLQVVDFSEEDDDQEDVFADAAMEFTLPPGELDRIFVESKVGTPPPIPPPVALDYGAAPMSTTAPPPPPPIPVEDDTPLPDIEVIRDNRSSEAVLRSYDSLEHPTTQRAGSLALWVGAAVVSALLLAGQVVHRHREALAAHGPWAPALRLLYSSIGAPLNAAPNLGVFQLRQWGVTGDSGTLRVRASILNTSSMLQPYPLLRLTLANRYGSALGARDFEPSEYMGKPITRALSPGETADAILNIHDPGKDAEGFEIDVCLRGGNKKILCADDLVPGPATQ